MSHVHGHFGIFDFAFVGARRQRFAFSFALALRVQYKNLSHPSAMIATRTAKTCFVYGTLMSEEVLQCLLGRIPPMQPKVILQNHSRHPVRQHVYPGVIPSTSTSASVEGTLLFDLSSLDLKLLDYFEEEGVDYKRTDVQVQIPDVSSLDEDIQTLVTNNSNKDDNYLSSRILKTQAYIWLKDTA
eukprot:scaffold17055_cov73-Skeletonema_marinoi.AAC.1